MIKCAQVLAEGGRAPLRIDKRGLFNGCHGQSSIMDCAISLPHEKFAETSTTPAAGPNIPEPTAPAADESIERCHYILGVVGIEQPSMLFVPRIRSSAALPIKSFPWEDAQAQGCGLLCRSNGQNEQAVDWPESERKRPLVKTPFAILSSPSPSVEVRTPAIVWSDSLDEMRHKHALNVHRLVFRLAGDEFTNRQGSDSEGFPLVGNEHGKAPHEWGWWTAQRASGSRCRKVRTHGNHPLQPRGGVAIRHRWRRACILGQVAAPIPIKKPQRHPSPSKRHPFEPLASSRLA